MIWGFELRENQVYNFTQKQCVLSRAFAIRYTTAVNLGLGTQNSSKFVQELCRVALGLCSNLNKGNEAINQSLGPPCCAAEALGLWPTDTLQASHRASQAKTGSPRGRILPVRDKEAEEINISGVVKIDAPRPSPSLPTSDMTRTSARATLRHAARS